LPNGAWITNTFDGNTRLLSTVLKNSGGTVLDSESYAYNQASQRTAETNTAGDFRNYTYDNASELKTAVGKEAGGTTNRLHEQLGYVYDAAGNLNFRTNNALIQNFAVNNLNELTTETNGGTLTVAGTTTIPATSVTVNGSAANRYADSTFALGGFSLVNGTNTFTAVGQDSYGHVSTNISNCYLPTTNSYSNDLNGNLLSDGTRNYAYDDENQLIGVSVANVWSNNFVYDGKFRRRIEKDYTWQSGAWMQTNEIHFIYDGNFVIQERNGSNIPQVTYTRSGSSLLARSDFGQEIPGSPTTAYYHVDGNANVTCLIYTNQIVAARYLYGPFGETLSLSGPLANLNVYRFASKEWNTSAGIYYFGRRYYDPILQRFLNHDPLAEQGGINLYAYVANNPINKFDLLGLENTATQGAETVSFLGEANNVIAETSGIGNWTVGINNANPSLVTVYTSGRFFGNQSTTYVGTVGTFAKVTSGALTIVNVGANIYAWGSGNESGIQASANIAVSGTAWGIGYFATEGGPIGLSLSGGYIVGGLINDYVPGVSENTQDFFQPYTDWYYGAYDFGPIQPLFPNSGPIEPLFPFYVPPCNH
jgi:RHS repeat-associated protein